MIDSLAGDVLHTSLTHISGADIIDGGREAILNLSEIFSGLLEYMLNKIDSDASTDNEGKTQLQHYISYCYHLLTAQFIKIYSQPCCQVTEICLSAGLKMYQLWLPSNNHSFITITVYFIR